MRVAGRAHASVMHTFRSAGLYFHQSSDEGVSEIVEQGKMAEKVKYCTVMYRLMLWIAVYMDCRCI